LEVVEIIRMRRKRGKKGDIITAKNPLFTKSHLEQLTLPLNSRELWTWVFVSILLGTH